MDDIIKAIGEPLLSVCEHLFKKGMLVWVVLALVGVIGYVVFYIK